MYPNHKLFTSSFQRLLLPWNEAFNVLLCWKLFLVLLNLCKLLVCISLMIFILFPLFTVLKVTFFPLHSQDLCISEIIWKTSVQFIETIFFFFFWCLDAENPEEWGFWCLWLSKYRVHPRYFPIVYAIPPNFSLLQKSHDRKLKVHIIKKKN